jgi:hypothetical protein
MIVRRRVWFLRETFFLFVTDSEARRGCSLSPGRSRRSRIVPEGNDCSEKGGKERTRRGSTRQTKVSQLHSAIARDKDSGGPNATMDHSVFAEVEHAQRITRRTPHIAGKKRANYMALRSCDAT